jgi:uncharacterized cupredoxin-like copper-binding protein
MFRFIFFGFLAVALIALSAVAQEKGGHERDLAYGVPGDPKEPARVVELSMRETDGQMLFAPNTVTVKQGEQIRFRLTNEGELDHEFVLGTAQELNEHAEMMKAMPDSDHEVPNGKRVMPNGAGELVWKFSKRGTFEFACLIPGHLEAGMHGTVIVK